MPKRHGLSSVKEDLNKVLQVCRQGHQSLRSLRPISIRAEQSRYMLTINHKDWAKLQSLGALRIKLANNHWNTLLKVRALQCDAAKRLTSLRENVAEFATPLGKLGHWKQIRLDLLAKAEAQGLSTANRDKTIQFLKGLSAKALLAPAESRLQADVARLDAMMLRTLAIYTAGSLATHVAHFNLLAQHKSKRGVTAGKVSAIGKQAAVAAKTLRDSIAKHAAEDAKAAAKQAVAAGQLVKQAIPEAVQLATRLAISRANRLPPSKFLNSQAVRIGNVLKLLIFIDVGSKVCEWLARSHGSESLLAAKLLPPSGTQLRKWLAADGFDVVELAGKTTKGCRILEGTVTHVKITHAARKAVSHVSLQGPTGRKMTAYLSHIKVNSAGIVPGAAVRLRVKSQAKIPWLRGQAADLIQRIDHEAAATKSWSMGLAYLLVPVFDVSPHSLAAEWSWDLGARGPGNPLKFGVLNRPNSLNQERITYVNRMRRGIQQMARSLKGS